MTEALSSRGRTAGGQLALEERILFVDRGAEADEVVPERRVRVQHPAQLARPIAAAQRLLDGRQDEQAVETLPPVGRQEGEDDHPELAHVPEPARREQLEEPEGPEMSVRHVAKQ